MDQDFTGVIYLNNNNNYREQDILLLQAGMLQTNQISKQLLLIFDPDRIVIGKLLATMQVLTLNSPVIVVYTVGRFAR